MASQKSPVGKRIRTRESLPVNTEVKQVLDKELGTIDAVLKEVICRTEVELDARSSSVRIHETPLANWIIDSIKPSYDSALVKLGYSKADVSIMNCGVIRGGQVYQPGGY
ncbi:hypothetical protein Ac2012v2_005333 [Leucoagaricus gongylophorus]